MNFNFFGIGKNALKEKKADQKKYKYEKVILLVLDGFGVNPDLIESPWKAAHNPNFEEIEKFYPFTALQASGIAVGLPFQEEGNSEVGHLSMGAGRIVYTSLSKISAAIKDKSFFSNPAFLAALEKAKNSSLHLVGLFSSGSVHASVEHLYALLDLAREKELPRVFLHLFTDGRDAQEKEGANFIEILERKIAEGYKNVKIASVIGREFAMDRDHHWDKIETAYRLLTEGKGEKFEFASEYIKNCYKRNIVDGFISAGFSDYGEPIKDGDAVIFFNFREDSMREISSAFSGGDFNKFKIFNFKQTLFVSMTEYEKKNNFLVAFPSEAVKNCLSKIISDFGKKQVHIAETEKYAHVTYFFNGGVEAILPGEFRVLIPSLRNSNFEENPQMSASEVAEAVIKSIPDYDFILANFANADMVGHTGDFNATIKAFEVLDSSAAKIISVAGNYNSVVLITGDHGNAEEKFYKLSGEKKTKHSRNPVPFYLISKDFRFKEPASEEKIRGNYEKILGSLTDIAPTVLELMDIPKPESMTGISLLKKLTGDSEIL